MSKWFVVRGRGRHQKPGKFTGAITRGAATTSLFILALSIFAGAYFGQGTNIYASNAER